MLTSHVVFREMLKIVYLKIRIYPSFTSYSALCCAKLAAARPAFHFRCMRLCSIAFLESSLISMFGLCDCNYFQLELPTSFSSHLSMFAKNLKIAMTPARSAPDPTFSFSKKQKNELIRIKSRPDRPDLPETIGFSF